MKAILKIFKSFRYALEGVVNTLKRERNFRVHIVAAIPVTGFGILYGLTRAEAAIIALTVAAVLSAELFNTAIEAAVDRSGQERDALGKRAKDASAGAVLVFALAAVAVAVCVFSDTARLLPALTALFTTWRVAVLAVYVTASVFFIIGDPKQD